MRMALEADSGPVTSTQLASGDNDSIIISRCMSLTRLQAIDGLVFTLSLVALGDDRRNLAAGLANTGHGGRAMDRTNAQERFESRMSDSRRERLAQRGCQKLPVSHK